MFSSHRCYRPASVAECFGNMLRNITPRDDETEQAITSHWYMRRRLEHQRPWILETFLTGSYKRKTAIHPLHDVDVFCVVHPDWAEHYHDCPVGIQHEVRLALRQIYPRTSILLQTHSLGVDFRTQRIGYDVIPAVPTEDPDYFQIVRKDPLCWTTGGTFILSCPAATEVEKEEANRLGGPGGRMLKLIRLMKHWNCKNNKMLKSFHLELMCYKAASELRSCMNDREACELLFQFLAYAVLEDCFVPGVDQNLRDTRTERERYRVQYKFTIAASRAREAVARERSNPAWAHEIWRSLFGSVYKY